MEHCSAKALGQMSGIFLTSRTWKNLGGLLGTCLSMRAAGAPDVTIHGPKGCMDMYEATKTFIVMHEFNVIGHNEDHGVYEDNAVTIRHVNLTSSAEPFVSPDPIYTFWKPGNCFTYLQDIKFESIPLIKILGVALLLCVLNTYQHYFL
jgi:hypothetical protein